jgi:DNA-binding NarL/FixJ family response regulator
MTTVDQGFSELVEALYDAALEGNLWPAALRELTRFTHGCAVGLVTKDATRKGGLVHHQYGSDHLYLELYRDRYWRFDPLATLLYYAPNQVVTVADVMSVGEFEDGPFYQDWVRPQGYRDAVHLVLDKSGTTTTQICLITDDSSAQTIAEMSRRLSQISGHLRRAILVGNTVAEKADETKALVDTLEPLAAAVFLVRRDGGIVHANVAGRSLLDTGRPVFSMHGRIATRDPKSSRALMGALSAGDGATVPLATDGDRFVAHVLPLTAGARHEAIAAPTAVAAVFIRKVAVDAPSAPEVIANAYTLTPSELRVLLAISTGGGVGEVARTLGVAETTVKTHLAKLYDKTGTSRQTDLVRLVAGFQSPLAA